MEFSVDLRSLEMGSNFAVSTRTGSPSTA